MPRSARAVVKPELLRWARDGAGLSVPVAAQKASVAPAQLESWEQGRAWPTVVQLRKLASVYKRPLAAFYLPTPPPPPPALHDFRRPGVAAQPLSPALRLAYRQALDRRQAALELLDDTGEAPPQFHLTARTGDDAEQVACELREQLRVTTFPQTGWKSDSDAFRAWRGACENAGVLVCQATDIDPDEMSGFSVGEFPLPVVVVNIKDWWTRRVFTVLHELVHLAMRSGGVCDLDERTRRGPEDERIEVFCNHVAGAMLVPMDELRQHEVVRHRSAGSVWSDAEIDTLTRHFRASREVVLRRLLTGHLTTARFYAEKREQFAREHRERAGVRRSGGPPPHVLAISKAGPLFAELVLHAHHLDRITASDVAGYLGLRVKHLPGVEDELFKVASHPVTDTDVGEAGANP